MSLSRGGGGAGGEMKSAPEKGRGRAAQEKRRAGMMKEGRLGGAAGVQGWSGS